jgi:Ni/Co efflux regulator RcnB
MNSKYAKLALSGLVMGLALGLSVPAASFAQDHDYHGGGGHAGDHPSSHGGPAPAARGGPAGPGGQRPPMGGAHPQPGGAPNPQVRVGVGGQPGYRGDYHGDYHGAPGHQGDVRAGVHFDYHSDARFHDYAGVRAGMYFAPGRGYYHVPEQWYGHRWGRGEFLPRFFFSYRIYDPDYYGLYYPPYGCAWMFVGEDAVLVDLDTGQIVDTVYGIF